MPLSLIMRRAVPHATFPSAVIYERRGASSIATFIYAEIHQIIIGQSIHLRKGLNQLVLTNGAAWEGNL